VVSYTAGCPVCVVVSYTAGCPVCVVVSYTAGCPVCVVANLGYSLQNLQNIRTCCSS